MTLDMKLTSAADAVRRSTDDATTTVAVPESRRAFGPPTALLAGLAVVLGIGVPVLLATTPSGTDVEQTEAQTDAQDDRTEASQPSAETVGFPFLAAIAEGWYPEAAEDSGNPASPDWTQVRYMKMSEDGSGGYALLRLQLRGEVDRDLDVLISLASSETDLTIAGRTATMHRIPDERAYAFTWAETSAVGGVLVVFGVSDEATARRVMESLEPISDEAWLELTVAHAVSTTTIAPDTPDG